MVRLWTGQLRAVIMRERRFLLFVVVLSVALAQTPVPSRPTGYVYQTSNSLEIVVEAFYDLLCPDSKANWPVFKQVMSDFSSSNVTGIIHIFPLPYHHNAYFMQQASVVVRRTDINQYIKLIDIVFQDQDMFVTGAVNLTEPEVQKLIAQFLSTNLQVDSAKIMEGFTDEVVTMDARYAWKYGASRRISGTPQFLVNGVHVPTAPGFSSSDWSQFLTTLLNSPY